MELLLLFFTTERNETSGVCQCGDTGIWHGPMAASAHGFGGGSENFRLSKGLISKGASGFGCKWDGPEQLESEWARITLMLTRKN